MSEKRRTGSTARRDSRCPCNVPRPLIYVASLADYNNGRLHGVWIRADRGPDAIRATIHAMLAASLEPCAQDWAIHDYESFGSIRLDPSLGIDAVARIASQQREC